MKQKIVIPVVLLVLVAAAAGGWWAWQNNPALQAQILAQLEIAPAAKVQGIAASGFIEAEEVDISTETGGRIKAMHVREGDEVTTGQVLIELDTDLLAAQRKQADAVLAKARAQMAQLQAGARPEQVRQAEVAVAQAETARDAARQAPSLPATTPRPSRFRSTRPVRNSRPRNTRSTRPRLPSRRWRNNIT